MMEGLWAGELLPRMLSAILAAQCLKANARCIFMMLQVSCMYLASICPSTVWAGVVTAR